MASRVKISTKGIAESLEALAQLGRDMDAAAGGALLAGGEVLKDGMKRRVPKDTHNLEDHIRIDGPHRDGNLTYIEVGVIGADADTARYGNAQEYGSSSMAAQPYIRPTVDEDKSKVSKAMKAKLAEELAK
jgi:HK97 gp10 family phage protein